MYKILTTLLTTTFLLVSTNGLANKEGLIKQCSKGFYKKNDGYCYPSSPYFYTKANGLRTGIKAPNYRVDPKMSDLGRLLFFDPLLSKSKKMSCASCHRPYEGFSENKRFSLGDNKNTLRRNTPSLWNTALRQNWFWDGRAQSLNEQAASPLFSKKEMNNTKENLLRDLNSIKAYRDLFKEAFFEDEITLEMVLNSLAEFQKTLLSLSSKYDQYAFGDTAALSSKELSGLNVFRSFVARCSECHTPPLFTNHQFSVIGVPEDRASDDRGRGDLLKNPDHDYSFQVPTLRNISKTAPYMHNGVFPSLDDAINFYSHGGGRGKLGRSVPRIHWHMRNMDLSQEEKLNLVLFLKTLTDESLSPNIPAVLPSGLKPIY